MRIVLRLIAITAWMADVGGGMWEEPTSDQYLISDQGFSHLSHPTSHLRSQNARPHVRLQDFRNSDSSVSLLIMLQNGSNDAGECEARSVQRVDETGLFARRRPVADVCATGLEVRERAAGRYLEPLANAGRKNLEIVTSRCSESRIASGQQHAPMRKAEPFEQHFGVSRQALMLLVALFRRAVAHHLHLVELVHSQEAACVLPCRPGFPPETG